jgi:P27 family predicted phage terminase small subunit
MSNRPTPSALRKLSGSNLHRLNANEPRYRKVDAETDAPSWLDAFGKEEWDRLAPELALLGTLNKGSLVAFASYCASVSQLRHAELYLAEHGLMIQEPIVSKKTGEIVDYISKASPAVSICNAAKTQIRAFAVEFGITPASATKVQVPSGPEKHDPFEEMMGGDEEETVTAPN